MSAMASLMKWSMAYYWAYELASRSFAWHTSLPFISSIAAWSGSIMRIPAWSSSPTIIHERMTPCVAVKTSECAINAGLPAWPHDDVSMTAYCALEVEWAGGYSKRKWHALEYARHFRLTMPIHFGLHTRATRNYSLSWASIYKQ